MLDRSQRRSSGRLGERPDRGACTDRSRTWRRDRPTWRDEDKHGRIFNALLRKRGLDAVAVPLETDYTMRRSRRHRTAHSRLRADQELTEQGIVAYLAHSRVTEQRASEQMQALCKNAG